MTTLKVKNYQLGQSATAAENFIVEADAAGVSVSTGTVGGGALTQNLKLNSNGGLEVKQAANQKVAAAASSTFVTLDCSTGNVFSYTLSNDTTFYVSNVPTGGVYQFTVILNYSTFYFLDFDLGDQVHWPDNGYSIFEGINRFTFLTDDDGAIWYGTAERL